MCPKIVITGFVTIESVTRHLCHTIDNKLFITKCAFKVDHPLQLVQVHIRLSLAYSVPKSSYLPMLSKRKLGQACHFNHFLSSLFLRPLTKLIPKFDMIREHSALAVWHRVVSHQRGDPFGSIIHASSRWISLSCYAGPKGPARADLT